MSETGGAARDGVLSMTAALESSFAGLLHEDPALGALTSLKVGGTAALLAEPRDEHDLLCLAAAINESGVACLVLGRGTNLLLSDKGFPGVVIRLGKGFEWIRGEGRSVEAGGATPLPQVSNWAARRSLTGMEFAIAIPASVGGAVRMNAGAHHSEVSQVFVSARICRMAKARIDSLSRDMLHMGYRSTLLGSKDVVCSAVFELRPGEGDAIDRRMKDHRAHRLSTQPADQPNAGSFFKNPAGSSAGGLIESAGLKGSRIGGAEVSHKHANFLVAYRGATAQDVYDLMAMVQAKVAAETGVLLTPEIHMVGEFDTSRGKVRFP